MRRLAVAVAALLLAGSVPGYAQAEPGQTITWGPCADIPAPELECGTFQAPYDWHAPNDDRKITIAVSRLKRSGPARGSVLTNPGGPGGPGRDLPLLYLERSKLVDNFEVIGIDVRGTGASTNLTCGGYQWLTLADPRDRSPRNVDLLYDAAELQATACQTKSGDFDRVVNTEQTVRDLDLLRQLLGREKINWIGYSGGTWMGAYYATYFPNRVDKFVLDSNVEFTTTFQDALDAFGMGFERRFRTDFLPWVAKHDSVYHLGTTGEEVRQVYERTRAKLAANPLTLPDGQVIDGVALDLVLIRGQYSKQAFPNTAAALAALHRGESVDAASAVAEPRFPDASLGTLYAITCNDTKFRGDRRSLARQAERIGTQYPLRGWQQVLAPCATWQRPPLQLKTPDGRGVPPVLMVQSVRDPATPLEGAQRAHRKFAGSRMITVTDEGDHGIYGFGNRCVDDLVEAFIVDGEVPASDLTCPGLPLPDPTAKVQEAPFKIGRF